MVSCGFNRHTLELTFSFFYSTPELTEHLVSVQFWCRQKNNKFSLIYVALCLFIFVFLNMHQSQCYKVTLRPFTKMSTSANSMWKQLAVNPCTYNNRASNSLQIIHFFPFIFFFLKTLLFLVLWGGSSLPPDPSFFFCWCTWILLLFFPFALSCGRDSVSHQGLWSNHNKGITWRYRGKLGNGWRWCYYG